MARGTFGELLKRERELREVTLAEITSATRIGPRFLEALENEDWPKLPGGVFNRGFVRSIARYLGLDEESFLAEYDLAHGAQTPPSSLGQENRSGSSVKWIPLALFSAFLAVLVTGGFYAWRYHAGHHSPKVGPTGSPSPLAAPAATSPLAPAPSAAGPHPPAPLDLFVSASTPTHLRVQADGNLIFDADLQPGDNRHFAARDQFQVSAEDSGAVLLELNGQAMPPLGIPGSSGTITLGRDDLRPSPGGDPKP